ncbi:MAG: prephenate dehydrogenase/arogenate dehydrogenase family protein [Pseudomonadales bacterium]|nr:prephenate dehydrogenase/arogenate dehydrogenase family protein [Pseudomonadales bacterium]
MSELHLANLKMLVIGAGLIGGSWAMGLKQRGKIQSVAAYARNTELLYQGQSLAVIDSVVEDLQQLPQAIAEADVIVLGVPTLAIKQYISMIQTHRQAHAVVTDVASVKGEVADMLVAELGAVPPWFILGHPIAGSEQSGISASNPNLYVNHHVILTPDAQTDAAALHTVSELWQAVGADVVSMPIAQHDKVLASTSHLPHALAFALVDTLRSEEENVEIFRFAAGGFRDFTRIAASHPVMWHDIMLANKSSILDIMGDFRAKLDELEAAMQSNDSEAILSMFERAKDSREEFAKLLAERQAKPAK